MTIPRILRRPEVLKICGFGSSTLDRRIQADLFTPPVNLCGRATGWPEHEVIEIVNAMISESEDIPSLVHRLVQQRQSKRSTNSTFNDRSQQK